LGLAFLRRDAEMLTAFDAIALVGALALAAASLQGEVIAQWYPLDLARGVITASAASIVGGFQLLLSDIQWHELPQDDRMRNVRRVLLGVALAAPVLLVFAALFASADQVFSNVLTNVFDFNLQSVISHTFFMAFWGFLVAGYLRWCMRSEEHTSELQSRSDLVCRLLLEKKNRGDDITNLIEQQSAADSLLEATSPLT